MQEQNLQFNLCLIPIYTKQCRSFVLGENFASRAVAFKFVYISETYAHLLKTLKVSKPQNREEVRALYQIVNLSEPRLDLVGYQRTGDSISLAFA